MTFQIFGCKESIEIDSNSPLNLRGGEDEIDVNDVLELLGESCVPESAQGCNDIEYIDTLVVTLPGYTGCSFTIVYKYYLCAIGTSLVDYTLGDFQIIDHNCPAFTTALNGAFSSGGTVLEAFVSNIEISILNQMEQLLITQNVPVGTFPCLQGVYFNIFFLKASCYKRCLIEFNNGSATYVKISCGSDCCERHTRVCRTQQGLQIETNYVPAYPPSCNNPPIFDNNPVLNRCIRTTSCSYSCPEE